MDIKIVELRDEKELTQCIKHNPSSIEPNLKIIDTFFKLQDGKEIDILAIDEKNRLVVIELKHGVDYHQLNQAVGYYDWILNNFDTIKRIFPNFTIEAIAPRLILIAEDFPEEILNLAKYLKDNIGITMYRYTAIQSGDEKIIVCNETKVSEPPQIFEKTTEDDLYNYIEESSVKEETKNLIKSIRGLDHKATAEVKNWWGFSIKYDGRVFGSIEIRKKYIHCNVKKDIYDEESWKGFEKISSHKNFEETLVDFKESFINAKKKMDNN